MTTARPGAAVASARPGPAGGRGVVRTDTAVGRLVVAVGAAAVAAAITFVALLLPATTYRASAEVILLPNPAAGAQVDPSGTTLDPGLAAPVAVAVLDEQRWLAPTADAAGIPPGSLSFSATAVPKTPMIQLSALTTDPHAAEVALTSLIAEASPTVEQLSGPYSVGVVGHPDGTATTAGVSDPLVRAVVVSVVFVVVAAGAWVLLPRRPRRHGGT
ncbi:MAG: hypothetical protein ABS81_02360 [Pseudonocardia sp. SCN 72-86]|nr:MAG: hypothetical protein ABS81_02360 [Pseudonocardia sp. SCN 72-86]